MTVGSGLGAGVGIAPEPSYGEYAPSTRWVEFESETIEAKPHRTEGKGLYSGGMVPRASQRATTSLTADGDIVMPAYSKGMGLWLGLIFGSMGITPAVQGATAAYLQTHTLANNFGQSASLQVDRPTLDGVSHAYNYLGCKVTKALFEAKLNEPLRLTLTMDSKDVQETSPLITAVYQSANPPFFWNEGVFQMGPLGAEVPVDGVRDFSLTIDRPQKVDNFYLDGTGRKGQPVQNGFVKITGAIQTDFLAKEAFVDVFRDDTPQSMVVSFTGGLIGGASSYGLTLRVPHTRFDAEGPKVAGPDILMPKMTYNGYFDDTTPPVTAEYTTTDVTL